VENGLALRPLRPAGGSRLLASLGRLAGIRPLLLLALPVGFLGVFYLWPLVEIARRSFETASGTGIGNYREFFGSSADVRVLKTTFETAAIVTAICVPLGYAYAYLVHIAPRRVATLLLFAVMLPFWSSLLVRSYAWTVVLRDTGVLNRILQGLGLIDQPLSIIRTQLAVAIGMTHILLPFAVFPAWLVMRRIDPDYGLAAMNLGAGPIRSFRRVFLPMSMPGVLAGGMLVFVLALGYFITPALLGGPKSEMLGQLIVNQVTLQLDWGLGSAMAMILTVITLVVLLLASRFVRVQDVFGARAGG
jgi:putative spermidine/putrescine transport system permease protein